MNEDQGAILHLLGLLFGHLSVCLLHLLQIFPSMITPEHVLKGSLVKKVIDVVESVLDNVTNDQVRVLPDLLLDSMSPIN
jgi:hypothetical protein